MSHVLLVTGGCRSGKSGYAQARAENLPGRRLFVATCPVLDDEMRARVERHRRDRAKAQWETLEQPLAVAQAIRDAEQYDTVLMDCLTLWVSNLMFQEPQAKEIGEDDVAKHAADLLSAARAHRGTVIFVTNEVGLGIVPENALARRYRDLAGRCNQVIGRGADQVVLMCCGLPLIVKGA